MNSALIVERSSSGGVRVAGKVTVDNASAALEQGRELGTAGTIGVVDLADLQSADSVTLAVLLGWAAQACRNGSRLTFVDVSSRLRAIAHLSDAEDLLGLESPR